MKRELLLFPNAADNIQLRYLSFENLNRGDCDDIFLKKPNIAFHFDNTFIAANSYHQINKYQFGDKIFSEILYHQIANNRFGDNIYFPDNLSQHIHR